MRPTLRVLNSGHLKQRAVVFTANGDPRDVLSVRTLSSLPPPTADLVRLRFLHAPINPSDLNVIQGVYPQKPRLVADKYYIPGNEGLATVVDVGPNVQHLVAGDWVLMKTPQLGTWASHSMVNAGDVLPLPPGANTILPPQVLATMSVNPPTALRMLSDFVPLKPGDWVIQNAANSAVGQAVIQIAKAKGFRTINFVRNRSDLQAVVSQLKQLGANHVCTYDDLADKRFRLDVKEWTANHDIRLCLNGVSGSATAKIASLLGQNAHIVNYGAMSKEPLTIPTSLFIFKNLKAHGYWQTKWYEQCRPNDRIAMMNELIGMFAQKTSVDANYESVPLSENDAEATEQIQSVMRTAAENESGWSILGTKSSRKLLLSWKP